MADTTRPRRIVEEFSEGFNRRDGGAASRPFASNCLNHGRVAGPEGLRAVLEDIYVRFPDVALTTANGLRSAALIAARIAAWA